MVRKKHIKGLKTEKLTLREINRLISLAEFRFNHLGLNSSLRLSAFKRLIYLEGEREKRFGIATPARRHPR